jgi:hypothetical protein
MNARFFYRPKLLQVGEFKEAFEQAVIAVMGSDAQITVTHPRHTGREGVSDDIELGVDSLRSVVDLNKIDLVLNATPPATPYSSKRVFIMCNALSAGVVYFYANSEESVQCLERVVLNLGLEQTEAPKDSLVLAFENLESRVSTLEKVA